MLDYLFGGLEFGKLGPISFDEFSVLIDFLNIQPYLGLAAWWMTMFTSFRTVSTRFKPK
jgi:hypothetical protein